MITNRSLRFALCAALLLAPLATLAAQQPGGGAPDDDGFFIAANYGASFPADRDIIGPSGTLGTKSNLGWLGGRFSLGYAIFGFRPEVSVGYHTASVASSTFTAGDDRAVGLSDVEGSVGSLDLAAGVYYGIDTGLGITPYLGGSGGLSLVTFKVHGHGAPEVEDTDDSAWAVSFQGAAGIGVAVTRRMSVTLGYRLTGTLEAQTQEQSTLDLALIHSGELGFRFRLY